MSSKRVLIYCRESRDDFGENYERIETQRDLLLKFCDREGYTNIVDVIMDNNVSGTNFDRLDSIKKMIVNDEIDTIVMKDSSRLGRNQIESLKFVNMLSEHNIELIFEGKKYDEDFFPLEAWFNERRAKDDSIKIRTNLKHKMEEGELLIRPHYGYNKEGNKLVVNPATSLIVKMIFDLYTQGYGYRAIAGILNKKNIPTPSQSRGELGRPVSQNWIAQHVSRILVNQTYVGDMVSNTTEKVSFKSQKTRRIDKKNWIINEDNHEPIIDRDTYYLAQEIRKKKKTYAPKSKVPHMFSGFLFCGKCGSPMFIINKKNRPTTYICGKYFKEGVKKDIRENYGCTSHRVRLDDLYELLNSYIEQMCSNEKYRDIMYSSYRNIEYMKNNCSTTIKKLESNLSRAKTQLRSVYNDKLNEIIPEFIYKEKSEELISKIDIIEKQIKELEMEIDSYQTEVGNIDNIDKIDKTIDKIISNGLDRKSLTEMMNGIIIYDENEISEQDMIKYNLTKPQYEDVLENGGMILDLKFNVKHVFTDRWM